MSKATTLLAVALAALPMSGLAQSLPSSVDLSSELPPVGDQTDIPPGSMSCQTFAPTYYQLTQYIKHFNHPEWDLTDPEHQFSPQFVLQCTCGCGSNNAPWPYGILGTCGCVDMAELPYEPHLTNHPSPAQYQAALPYRVTSYTNVWYIDPNNCPPYANSQQVINSAKAWLASGHVLNVGLTGGPDFPASFGNPTAFFYDADYIDGEPIWVGHEATLCGYDDNINPSGADPDRRGGFLMVNSFGPNWNGDMHGFLWLSYNFVKQFINQCVVITGVNPDTPSISDCTPSAGRAGDVISIYGNNFGSYRRASAVNFNGVVTTNVTFQNGWVTATVPAGAASGPLIVYNWEGTPSNPIEFTVIPTVKLTATMRGGGILLQATGTARKSLQFFTSTDLANWTPWVRVPNPSGTVQVSDPAPSAALKYYRAEQQ